MGLKKPKLKDGETITFAANPYYDEILVFADIQVPTSQDFYKLVDQEKQLYQLIQKSNVQEFKQKIQERLNEKKKSWWPHKNKMSLTINVGGPKNYIELKDLDNYLKTIFDAIKGVVIVDDHQITSVTIDKEVNPFVSGFMIAIKTNPIEGEPHFHYGDKPENWAEERKLKIERGGLCCMDAY